MRNLFLVTLLLFFSQTIFSQTEISEPEVYKAEKMQGGESEGTIVFVENFSLPKNISSSDVYSHILEYSSCHSDEGYNLVFNNVSDYYSFDIKYNNKKGNLESKCTVSILEDSVKLEVLLPKFNDSVLLNKFLQDETYAFLYSFSLMTSEKEKQYFKDYISNSDSIILFKIETNSYSTGYMPSGFEMYQDSITLTESARILKKNKLTKYRGVLARYNFFEIESQELDWCDCDERGDLLIYVYNKGKTLYLSMSIEEKRVTFYDSEINKSYVIEYPQESIDFLAKALK